MSSIIVLGAVDANVCALLDVQTHPVTRILAVSDRQRFINANVDRFLASRGVTVERRFIDVFNYAAVQDFVTRCLRLDAQMDVFVNNYGADSMLEAEISDFVCQQDKLVQVSYLFAKALSSTIPSLNIFQLCPFVPAGEAQGPRARAHDAVQMAERALKNTVLRAAPSVNFQMVMLNDQFDEIIAMASIEPVAETTITTSPFRQLTPDSTEEPSLKTVAFDSTHFDRLQPAAAFRSRL